MDNNILDFIIAKEKRMVFMCTILEKIRYKNPTELLTEYHIDPEPPIDISALLTNIGISTISKDFSEIETQAEIKNGSILGATISNGENLIIFYKKSSSWHRKKFTIAHELAHCCLDCPTNETRHIELRLESILSLNLGDDIIRKEQRANIFAGELLIPENSLIQKYNQMLVPSLKELAIIFDVSTSVMAARLEHLNLAYYKDTGTKEIFL